jgi:hypothetical protein
MRLKPQGECAWAYLRSFGWRRGARGAKYCDGRWPFRNPYHVAGRGSRVAGRGSRVVKNGEYRISKKMGLKIVSRQKLVTLFCAAATSAVFFSKWDSSACSPSSPSRASARRNSVILMHYPPSAWRRTSARTSSQRQKRSVSSRSKTIAWRSQPRSPTPHGREDYSRGLRGAAPCRFH